VGERILTDSGRLNGILHDSGKVGTPTMGGVLIVAAVLISTAAFAKLDNLPILLALWTTAAMGVLGAFDDWQKLTVRGSKGMSATRKLLCQGAIAAVVVATLYAHAPAGANPGAVSVPMYRAMMLDLGAFYLIAGVFVVVGASNAVNLTDGLDGLAIGCTLIASAALTALAYVTGHVELSDYLDIQYLRQVPEVTIFCGSMVGASLGFLWYNAHPAEVFMGDVGSLALGGAIGTVAVIIKQELLLPFIGGVFVLEALSVMIQVVSFKTRGKRVFLMAPLHHHFELLGWKESKIIIRFWIASLIFALFSLSTLKLR
jgi:phospho-N-acetylmuramoyl-pentapeptide-transferase